MGKNGHVSLPVVNPSQRCCEFLITTISANWRKELQKCEETGGKMAEKLPSVAVTVRYQKIKKEPLHLVLFNDQLQQICNKIKARLFRLTMGTTMLE